MNLKSLIWFAIHNNRRNKAVGRLAKICKNIHRASEHPGYDVNRNGEQAVLARVISHRSPIIFDVGANIGDWTAMAQSAFPDATVHSFELNPATAVELTKRFSRDQKICVHSFGLAAKSGEVEFFAYSGEASILSGLRVPLHSHVPHTKKSTIVCTGDEVCERNNIGNIDFLKIDAEGFDFEVLSGFHKMLENQKISAIQFEHEGGRYLRDFYDFLGPLGYSIGKLYANYVDFREHEAQLEHFLGPNYIAIPETQHHLLRRLQTGWKAGGKLGG